MKILTTLLFFFLLISNSQAQRANRHTVYFAKNKHAITQNEQKKLDAFITRIRGGFIESIVVDGHTDSDGSDAYNIKLSQRRVKTVEKQLAKLNNNHLELNEMFHGEAQPIDANTTSKGKQHNRRVEIVVNFQIPREVTPPPPPIPSSERNPEKAIVNEIEGDTTITLPQGTLIILPKKDFVKNPNCVSVVEYVDGESVRDAGLSTMSAGGSSLISGGMFDVKMCDESECITMLVPTRTVCGQVVPFTQWTAESNNAWLEKTGRPLPVVMIGDQGYYKMTVCKSGMINCDLRSGSNKCQLFIPKTRIKLKNGYRIKSIQLASDEPMMLENPIRKTKRKAVFTRTCPCSEPLLFVEATNKVGETKTIGFSPLNEFDKREALGKCKTSEIEKKILFFKIKKKTKYRKYIIHEQDFDKKE